MWEDGSYILFSLHRFPINHRELSSGMKMNLGVGASWSVGRS